MAISPPQPRPKSRIFSVWKEGWKERRKEAGNSASSSVRSTELGEENYAGSEPAETSIWTALLLTLPFIGLFLVQIVHHQLWRDELNAWGIAAASPNLATLFHYIHYEGHPALWYVMLWIVSRFTTNPIAMKCLEAVIGVLIYLMIGLKSPFTRTERLLLFLSYFVSFEYTVLSRMYGICFLLVLIYVYRRAKYPEQIIRNAALLGLISGTDMLGIILSGAMAIEYGFDLLGRQRLRLGITIQRVLAGAAVYLALLAASVASLLPTPDISWRTTGHMFAYVRSVRHFFRTCVDYLALPWLPVRWGLHHFWNPDSQGPRSLLYLAFLPVALVALYWLFRRDRNLLLLLAVTAVGAVTFGHLVYLGSMRHYGIMFLAWLVAFWLQRYRRPKAPALGYLILVLSAISGIWAGVAQWTHPFSNAGNTAQWLRAHHLENAALVGTPDTSTSGVAEILRRPIYFLDCSCSDTFLLFGRRRDSFSMDQIPQRLEDAARDLHTREMIFMDIWPLEPSEIKEINRHSLEVTPIAALSGSEMPEEDFYLYKIVQQQAH